MDQEHHLDVSVDDRSLDHGFFIDPVRTGRVIKKQSPGSSRFQGFYFRLHPFMSDERGAETTRDVLIGHCCDGGDYVRLTCPITCSTHYGNYRRWGLRIDRDAGLSGLG